MALVIAAMEYQPPIYGVSPIIMTAANMSQMESLVTPRARNNVVLL